MRATRRYLCLYSHLWIGTLFVSGTISECPCTAKAVDEIWFSTSSTVPGSPGSISVNYNSLASQTLYVWVTSNVSDEITPPVTGYTNFTINGQTFAVPNSSAGIGVNYGITAGSSISLTGASDINPVLIGSSPSNTRWAAVSNFTVSGNPSNASGTLITALNADVASIEFTPGGAPNSQSGIHLGLSSANVGTGGNPTDPNYVSGDWLLGSVTFDTTSLGSTTLAIQQSSLGIDQGNTDLTNAYTYDSANISVVPEPSTIALLTLGALGLLARRRFASSRVLG